MKGDESLNNIPELILKTGRIAIALFSPTLTGRLVARQVELGLRGAADRSTRPPFPIMRTSREVPVDDVALIWRVISTLI